MRNRTTVAKQGRQVEAPERARVEARDIPSVDFGGEGRPLHFLHANGYPPACYKPLIQRLTDSQHVFGMMLRPLWPEAEPDAIQDWSPFSEDLRHYLHQRDGGPVIGMGHSIGAVVTLRAALQEPGLFRALVLMDPVLLPSGRITQLRIMRKLGLADRLNARAEAALRRRRHFDSLEQLFSGYRRRDVFRYLSDERLQDLVEGMTEPSADGGYDLAYSPIWEARIYQTAMWNDQDIWKELPKLRVPTLMLRGAHTDTFWAQTARLVEKRNPAMKTVTIPDSTHLVPLERPNEVADAAQAFIDDLA